MVLKSFGAMGVNWLERVDFQRLRQERLDRSTTDGIPVGIAGVHARGL